MVSEIPYEQAKREFERKAPLLEFNEMKDILVTEIIDEKLLERTRDVWLHGSFVQPDAEIDTGDKLSDMDAFIVVPSWELPVANTGIAWAAPQAPRLESLDHLGDHFVWNELPAEDEGWNCSAGEAWEQLPDCAKTTLLNSTQRFLFANENDHEARRARNYDIMIGSVSQFDHQKKKCPKTKIWERSD
ncbi:hypothetical protein EA472_15140 [Natrarchaeobius oligotrophus]|uniref:Uncharacterized protein n=1 Tax=Natrarchaeobius chitinivorans TaxID=1679083 RepID=A0A3N6MNV8_NATCH|nr:hypothetical protein EA472_15140 [Natrarchaeobius chitinivorans]